MVWTKNPNIIGNESCTQFMNTAQDQLNPQTAYQTAPFITTNSTTAQTITFPYFDTLNISQSNTKTLSATASSGLVVSFESLDTSIATVSGTTMTALSAGTVYIKATQAGNATYDPATPIFCLFTIVQQQQQVGPSGKIETPITVTVSTAKSNVKTITIVISDIRYTKYSGISYGYATGFVGSAMIGSITCTDSLGNNLVDFTDNPLNVTISMANADTTHSYKIWKRNGSSLVVPQPTGYPVQLTYVSGTNWNGSMTSLSEIVILDDTPPAGKAGGDPYVVSVKGVKTLLPNEWKKVRLLETNTVKIIANCDYLSKDVIGGLHFINKNKGACLVIDPNVHKWVKDLTYILSLDFIDKEGNMLSIDTVDGHIIYDSSNLLYEIKKDTEFGLFSITHGGHYPHVAFKQFIVYFDGGYVTISIDKFWDDINYIQLFGNNDDSIGELIEHNSDNNLS